MARFMCKKMIVTSLKGAQISVVLIKGKSKSLTDFVIFRLIHRHLERTPVNQPPDVEINVFLSILLHSYGNDCVITAVK
jgi:hypothetical protein